MHAAPAAGNGRIVVAGFALAVLGLAVAVTVCLRAYVAERQHAERLAVACDSLRSELTGAGVRAHRDSLALDRAGLGHVWVRELQEKGLGGPRA